MVNNTVYHGIPYYRYVFVLCLCPAQQISKAISKAQQELREIELPPPLPAKMPRPVALNEETRGYIRLIRSDINATDGKMFHFFNNPLVYAVVYPLLGFGPEVAELVRSLVTSL